MACHERTGTGPSSPGYFRLGGGLLDSSTSLSESCAIATHGRQSYYTLFTRSHANLEHNDKLLVDEKDRWKSVSNLGGVGICTHRSFG